MNKDILIKLRESAEFRDIMAEIAAFRPVVPLWHPSNNADDAQKLVDEIKFATGKQQGFDTLFLILTGKREFDNG